MLDPLRRQVAISCLFLVAAPLVLLAADDDVPRVSKSDAAVKLAWRAREQRVGAPAGRWSLRGGALIRLNVTIHFAGPLTARRYSPGRAGAKRRRISSTPPVPARRSRSGA